MSGDNKSLIDKDLLSACIHCGLCLPACPTYLATGREMESPRGRIYLMSLWANGEEPLTARMAEHIDSCLGCLGCQTACPSGVQYENILNQARPHLTAMRPSPVRAFMRFIFKYVLPDYRGLQFWGKILRLWQEKDASRLLQKLPDKGIFARLKNWESFLPQIPAFKPLPRRNAARGDQKGITQLFAGCVMDIFYNDVNHASIRLLQAQSQAVEVSPQTCCGALAMHSGEMDIAKDLARKNIDLFEKTQGEIVVTAAGCGAMLKEYSHLLKDEPEWKDKAEKFCRRVCDISQFLATHEFQPEVKDQAQAPGGKVAYHAACHLAHAQKVHDAPGKLLSDLAKGANTQAMEVVPLKEAEHCCGSAGIFNLTHEELSNKVLARKMNCIGESGATTVVTTNPGCLLQLEAGVQDLESDIKVVHLATFLDEAYMLTNQP